MKLDTSSKEYAATKIIHEIIENYLYLDKM